MWPWTCLLYTSASHELRTPLMSIGGYAQGIQCGVFPDHEAAAGVILEETLRMLSLIHIFGSMLLPMHIPVLICGYVCGWRYGLLVGLVTPLLRSMAFGMPPLFPTATAMALSLIHIFAAGDF